MKRLALIFALLAGPATAQEVRCGDYAKVTKELAEKYGETRQSAGITDTGNLLEIWANAETGSWTVLIVAPNSRACVPTTGGGFVGYLPVKFGEAL